MITLKNLISGSFWGVVGKIVDAFTKFIAIPLLIGHYGKFDYGMVALVISLNAYLRLLDLGLNIGGVRFFSMWFANNNHEKIIKVSQSSILIYGIIGVINAAIFIALAFLGQSIFDLNGTQILSFRAMMITLALTSIINWIAYVVEQLLLSIEQFGWLSKMSSIVAVSTLIAAYTSVHFNLSLPIYYLLFSVANLLVIPFNVYRLSRTNIAINQLLKPSWYLSDFKEVAKYSAGIFAMGIFQVSADALRPIFLTLFANEGIGILTDYRILQTIALIIVSLGGVFLTMLIPISSKIIAEDNQSRIKTVINKGTLMMTAFLAFFCSGIILNAEFVINVYVGKEYIHLSNWLILWLVSLLINMHTFPISSMILSSGKTKPLIIASGIGCLISLIVTIALAKSLNVGAAVLGYLSFVTVNCLFTYIYYLPKVLGLNSKEILMKSVLPVVVLAIGCILTSVSLSDAIEYSSETLKMLARSTTFSILFLPLFLFAIMNRNDVNVIFRTVFRPKSSL